MAVVSNGAKLTVNWTETELAYFAGILDGEGCLSIDNLTVKVSRGRRLYGNPRIRVSNTDARLIQWIQARVPGKVSPVTMRAFMRKPQWTWELFGPSVETVLVAVLPYLVIKHEQAELLIAYRRTMLPKGRQPGYGQNGNILSPQTLIHRASLKDRITLLNKRGAAS